MLQVQTHTHRLDCLIEPDILYACRARDAANKITHRVMIFLAVSPCAKLPRACFLRAGPNIKTELLELAHFAPFPFDKSWLRNLRMSRTLQGVHNVFMSACARCALSTACLHQFKSVSCMNSLCSSVNSCLNQLLLHIRRSV